MAIVKGKPDKTTFVLTVVMVPIRLLGLMLCSDDMEWGTRKLEEDNDKVEVP